MSNLEMFELLVSLALEKGASDIHLKENHPVAFRLRGSIVRDDTVGVITRDNLEGIMRDFELSVESLYAQFYLDAGVEVAGTRLRLHFSMTSYGITLSARLIPVNIPDFETLKLPEPILKLIDHRAGLVIVTGATGSGKSTTMASLVNRINKTKSKHIITVEDPIEYVYREDLSLIEQREVGMHVESFDAALVQAMREDPDILLLGELRDLDTIQSALRMAETGHLVFGTLHTRGAAESFSRILDVFPGDQQNQIRTQLAEATIGVLSQQLVPTSEGKIVPLCELLFMTSGARGVVRNPEGKLSALTDIIAQSHKSLGSQSFSQGAAWLVNEGYAQVTDFDGVLTEEELLLVRKFTNGR